MTAFERLATAAVLTVTLAWPTTSLADDIDVGAGDGGFLGEGTAYESERGPQSTPSGGYAPAGDTADVPQAVDPAALLNPCGSGIPSITGAFWGPSIDLDCGGSESSTPAPVPLSTTAVARAFREIPVPPAPLHIQPPDGETLVNFRTNFFTEVQSFNRTITLLGRRVELRIEAASYTWHFGDGETLTTEEPGAPYPKLRITHSYLKKGTYGPSLDTTYVADFRVGGGPWREVPGSVTIEGTPVSLRAIEARPTLVGYDG